MGLYKGTLNPKKGKRVPLGYQAVAINPYEVGYIFLVPPKGDQVYTLTNIGKEPEIHSPLNSKISPASYKPYFSNNQRENVEL